MLLQLKTHSNEVHFHGVKGVQCDQILELKVTKHCIKLAAAVFT